MNNYKPISIVAKKGYAIVMNHKKEYASIHAKDNMTASLLALKAVLSKIPTNNDMLLEEPRLILLWFKSPIVGFATGTYIEYLRTNHTASGIPFSIEEITLIRECALLLAERNLNVSICTDRFISNNNYRELIDAAWTAINKCISTNNTIVTDKKQETYNKKQRLDRLMNRRKIKINSSCEENSALVTDSVTDISAVQKIKTADENKITAVEKTKNKNLQKSKNKNSATNSSIYAGSNCIISGPFSSWQLLVETNRVRANEASEVITNKSEKVNNVRRLYNSCRECVD